jgi:thioredoxin reductase
MSAVATTEKIAIIGAGPVGISVARALKAKGIAYDQFEAGSAIGGNWCHGVYHTAHIISSRKTTEFPDYPMPSDYPDFPSAAQMLSYLEDYVAHYGLHEQIILNTEVTSVAPALGSSNSAEAVNNQPSAETQLWELKFNNRDTALYEGVVVCNGHHWDPRWPKYDGEFTGEMIHSKDYKSPSQLQGKRVLVIGGGNSACDIVSEAARVGKSSHLSLRRGYWFLPKTLYGMPTAELLTTWMPVWMQRIHIETLLKIVVGDYRDYGLMKPDHKIFEHHPTINTELLHYLKHGKIKPHPDVKKFDGKTVEFVDGVREEFDLIVCGTGFHVSIPFLAPNVVNIKGPVVEAHWEMIAPHHRQLYIYGWGQARYGFGPLLTPASDLLADLILMQRKLKHPLGEILTKMRQPLPKNHLLDPMEALNRIRKVRRAMWVLPLVDNYL